MEWLALSVLPAALIRIQEWTAMILRIRGIMACRWQFIWPFWAGGEALIYTPFLPGYGLIVNKSALHGKYAFQ